jgi:hypothetical protein
MSYKVSEGSNYMHARNIVSRGMALLLFLPFLISCAGQARHMMPEGAALYSRTEKGLNGFLLHQYKKAVEGSLGPPSKTIEQGPSKFEAHIIDKDAYMLFGYLNNMPHTIFSIQLTGKTSRMKPFNGLMLGDDKEKVIKALGEPSTIVQIDQPRVQRYEYKDANYSVEVDGEGKLYSIRISSYQHLLFPSKAGEIPWQEFKAAVLRKEWKEIMSYLRPDMEIHKGGKALFIDKSFNDFTENPNPIFSDLIVGEKDSVGAQLQHSEPEQEIRLAQYVGAGWVFKFYKGEVLREIVFSRTVVSSEFMRSRFGKKATRFSFLKIPCARQLCYNVYTI